MPLTDEDSQTDESASGTTEVKLSSLQQEFIHMERLLKRTFSMVSSGMKLPVLDLRNGLSALLGHIDDYNVISFLVPSGPSKGLNESRI